MPILLRGGMPFIKKINCFCSWLNSLDSSLKRLGKQAMAAHLCIIKQHKAFDFYIIIIYSFFKNFKSE